MRDPTPPAADCAQLLATLLADPARVSDMPREEAARLLVDLARVERALELRALSPAPTSPPAESNGAADGLLSAGEVARRLDVATRTVYDLSRRADWKGFTLKVGGSKRYQRRGFERWLARQMGS